MEVYKGIWNLSDYLELSNLVPALPVSAFPVTALPVPSTPSSASPARDQARIR